MKWGREEKRGVRECAQLKSFQPKVMILINNVECCTSSGCWKEKLKGGSKSVIRGAS